MTTDEQARAVALHWINQCNGIEPWVKEDTLTRQIASALHARERAVWEEAARRLDEDECLETPDELDPRCKIQCFAILARFSTKFRQQAKEAGWA